VPLLPSVSWLTPMSLFATRMVSGFWLSNDLCKLCSRVVVDKEEVREDPDKVKCDILLRHLSCPVKACEQSRRSLPVVVTLQISITWSILVQSTNGKAFAGLFSIAIAITC